MIALICGIIRLLDWTWVNLILLNLDRIISGEPICSIPLYPFDLSRVCAGYAQNSCSGFLYLRRAAVCCRTYVFWNCLRIYNRVNRLELCTVTYLLQKLHHVREVTNQYKNVNALVAHYLLGDQYSLFEYDLYGPRHKVSLSKLIWNVC